MTLPAENDPAQRRGDAVSSENRPWPLASLIAAAFAVAVSANSWLSGSGSWPDSVYGLIMVSSLSFVVAGVVHRRRARTKHH